MLGMMASEALTAVTGLWEGNHSDLWWPKTLINQSYMLSWPTAVATLIVVLSATSMLLSGTRSASTAASRRDTTAEEPNDAVLPALRNRRSVFPKSFIDQEIPASSVELLLDAAMWAPYHGKKPPWHFVVLGRRSMVEMQRRTLDYYDAHWRTHWPSHADYDKWRAMTEEEITGRWGPVSFMIMIVMRRQAGEKRMEEWEEAAAVACAVQNMHIQACANPGIAAYWSSWHSAFRDSDEMRTFLGIGPEDRCLGMLVVAACDPDLKDQRVRDPGRHMSSEWRD